MTRRHERLQVVSLHEEHGVLKLWVVGKFREIVVNLLVQISLTVVSIPRDGATMEVRSRGANETRQLASYSNSTQSKLGQNLTRVSSTRNVNESSRATCNSTRNAREKLENILYIKF